MKKLVILLILLAAVVFTAGCTEENQENSTNLQENQDINGTVEATESGQNTTLPETQHESGVVQVTNLEQINASLKQGPVLMKIGSKHCGSCQAMNPMLEELATEYSGRVTIVSVDITKSPDLATYFDIVAVPDTTLIMGIEKGNMSTSKKTENSLTIDFRPKSEDKWKKMCIRNVSILPLSKRKRAHRNK